MTAVREGASGGSTNTRRAGRLVPPPSIGGTAAAARVCPASSPTRSKASLSRTALCDAKTEPDVEASADRNPGSLAHHRPVSPSPCDKYREPHGGEDASSSVASLSASSPDCSNVSSSLAAAYNATDPKQEPEVEGSTGRNTEMLHEICGTSGRQGCYRNSEPHGSEDKEKRRLPTRIDSAKSSAILESIRLQKTRQPSQLQRGGTDSYWRDPQVRGKKNEVSDHQYWHTDTVSSLISSARDSKLEFIDAFEGGNRSAKFKKSLAMSPREPVRLHFPRPLSVLDRRGALDAISESRLLEGHIPTARCPKQELLSTSTRASNLATCEDNLETWEGKTYITTLGPGGGYGYPHPPPFYKCEVCRKETAFYRLKCCHIVVCECCGCLCAPTEADKDKRLQHQREKLPKVKLEGSDLFLWQPCSFPDGQMLWMAKRAGNHLQYYFAPIDKLMDPKVDSVEVCVYDFCQQGHNVISLSKTVHLLARNLLR